MRVGKLGDRTIIIVASRLLAKLFEGKATINSGNAARWQDTSVALPDGSAAWFDVLSGAQINPGKGPLQVASLFAHFPVVLLANSPEVFD